METGRNIGRNEPVHILEKVEHKDNTLESRHGALEKNATEHNKHKR